MATTHKRTRTGCWTCREAGYKCDEQKPFCQRCTRLKITCKGYGVRLKWQDQSVGTAPKKPRASRKKRSQSAEIISTPSSWTSDSSTYSKSTASPDAITPRTLAINIPSLDHGIGLNPDFSATDRRLLHYWVEQLSSMISVAPRNGKPTPFQLHLTSMAYDSAALRSTVLSMAANHLALQTSEPALRFQAYRHQRDAIHQLQELIQDPRQAHSESALATVLMMQVSARLFGEDDEANVANHLMGAKAMISRRGGADTWLNSSSARFLLSLFAYHDILSSISRGQQPLFNHDADFHAIEGAEDMHSIASILLIVARTSHLQHAIKLRRENGGEHALTEAEDATGRALQQHLLALQPSTQNISIGGIANPDIAATAEAYRHAAFIYLYRTWLGVGAPNPISADHITACLFHISLIPLTSPLTSSHIWPLFSAGCECIDEGQRAFVKERFRGMYEQRLFPSWKRVMRDVGEVWEAKDEEMRRRGEGGMERVDCIQVILRRRGREVDLA